MAKKKRRAPGGGGKKKKKKDNPVAALLREHPDLSREIATEIVEAGMTVEEWEAEQERKREERRRLNHERIVAVICLQHPDLTNEQADEIANRGITPEEYKEELQQAESQARRQQRRGGPRGRKPGPPRKKKKWDNNKKRASKKKLMRKKAVDEVMEKYPELTDRAVAGQIASGRLTYEEYVANRERPKARKNRVSHRSEEEHARAKALREERQRKLEERVERESHLGKSGDTYLQKRIEADDPLRVLRFHKPPFVGTLNKIEPFRLFLKAKNNPNLALTKRFCSLIAKEEEWDKVASQLSMSLRQKAMRQMPHHEPSMRYVVPEELLGEDKSLWVMLHEGIFFSGEVVWFDRFQIMLELPEGGSVFVFRHAIHRAAAEAPEVEGEVVPYAEFQPKETELPEVHPKELPLEDIFIPVQFNDYSVKDQVYEKYEEAYDNGDFTFDPLQVRREGDHYVLVDGYRRWYLAKEKEVDSIPIFVI